MRLCISNNFEDDSQIYSHCASKTVFGKKINHFYLWHYKIVLVMLYVVCDAKTQIFCDFASVSLFTLHFDVLWHHLGLFFKFHSVAFSHITEPGQSYYVLTLKIKFFRCYLNLLLILTSRWLQIHTTKTIFLFILFIYNFMLVNFTVCSFCSTCIKKFHSNLTFCCGVFWSNANLKYTLFWNLWLDVWSLARTFVLSRNFRT